MLGERSGSCVRELNRRTRSDLESVMRGHCSFLWSCLSLVVLGVLLQQPTSDWHPCYLQNGINHILLPWGGFAVAYRFLFFVPPFLLSEALDLQLDDFQNLPPYLLIL